MVTVVSIIFLNDCGRLYQHNNFTVLTKTSLGLQFTLGYVNHFCEVIFFKMRQSNAHQVTLRAALEILFMYLCPHIVRQ